MTLLFGGLAKTASLPPRLAWGIAIGCAVVAMTLAIAVRAEELPQPQRALRLLPRLGPFRRLLAALLGQLGFPERKRLAALPLLLGDRLLLLLHRALGLSALALRFLGLLLADQSR